MPHIKKNRIYQNCIYLSRHVYARKDDDWRTLDQKYTRSIIVQAAKTKKRKKKPNGKEIYTHARSEYKKNLKRRRNKPLFSARRPQPSIFFVKRICVWSMCGMCVCVCTRSVLWSTHIHKHIFSVCIYAACSTASCA